MRSIRHIPRAISLLLAVALVAGVASPARGEASPHGDAFVEVIPLSGLDFGTIAQNFGSVFVGRTDPYVGKYKVRAVGRGGPPTVTLSLMPPHGLEGPRGTVLPYVMEAAYNVSADDAASATVLGGSSIQITLEIPDGFDGSDPIYAAFVYLFGAVSVGHVPVGDYLGMATLQAELEPDRNPCFAPPWERHTRYYEGDVVTHLGGAWMADRMTIGNEPGKAHDWDPDSGKGKGRPWNLLAICD